MGNTPNYNLFYLEPGVDTANFLNADEQRFKTLDTQLYAIYSIFKNGIIADESNNFISWQVNTYSDERKFTKISISPGKGVVSYKSSETTDFKDIDLPILPVDVDNVKIWVYAVENVDTPVTKDVDFVASLVKIDDTENYINIGGVTLDLLTNQISVFNDERQNIDIFSSLSNLINTHKHIGGSSNPSPVDLTDETKNKLSGENIENIDLSLVTRGKLNANRLSTIDHDDLTNKGNLSHNQIESLLAQNLLSDETYRMSDLSIANRLQALINIKKYVGLGTYIDSTQLNTIVFVPGIWPNTRTNTSVGTTAIFSDKSIPSSLIGATILDTEPWGTGLGISGKTSDTVFSDNITYTTKRDFDNSISYNTDNNIGFLENIKTFGSTDDNIDGYFTISTPLNFKSIAQPVTNIFNTSSGWYRATNTTSNYSNSNVSVDTRLYVYKMFDNPILMNDVSKIGIGFSVGLGVTSSAIGQVHMYLVLGSDDDDPKFANDIEVNFDSGQFFPTTSPSKLFLSSNDGTNIGYKIFDDQLESSSIGATLFKTFDLSDFWPSEYRTSIKGLGFYFSSLLGWNPEKSINFHLNTPNDDQVNPSPYDYDDLQIARKSTTSNSTASIISWNETLYSPTGQFLIRFDSGYQNSTYDLVRFNQTKPDNTEILVQTRTDLTSNTFYDLKNLQTSNSVSTGYLNTSSNTGRYLDVLFTLTSNPSRSSAPYINDFVINYTTIGTGNTKVFDSRFSSFTSGQTGWDTELYYSNNIGFGDTYADTDNKLKNKLKILSTSGVGNWIYLRNNSAITVDYSNNESTFEDGVDSSLVDYLSPVQIYNKSVSYGFNNPKDFYQVSDGSNLYCDTGNDRVMLFDVDGNLTKLIQGNIRLKRQQRDFVLLGAYLNPDIRKMWVAFSQNISTTTPYDLTKIYIIYDNISVRLDDSRIDQNNTGLFDPINGQSATLEITFNNNFTGQALANNISQARYKTLRVDSGAFTNGGFVENTVGIGTETIDVRGVKSNNSLTFLNSLTSTYTGTSTTSTGLSSFISDQPETLDFNDDNIVPTDNTLFGPNDQVNEITVDIISGPIYFRNIYNPISVHYSLDKIIIAQPFEQSILAFNDDDELTMEYSVPFEIAPFLDTKLGSIYETSEGMLLIGCPGVNDSNGKLLKYKVSGGLIETKIIFQNLDVVKALPGPSQDLFYVLLDDQLSSGLNTRLKLIDSTGNILSTWGDNYELIHPKGMKTISNNDILVSE